jgi:hypothetical protein
MLEHTYSLEHKLCRTVSFLFMYVTLTCLARFRSSARCYPPTISSVTGNHDGLYKLPAVQGGG